VLEDKPNKDRIERAEDLILRLREVQSARIYADEQGNIAEIHVVVATDRAPKLIARDVESCLKAALGITVDYRKIGVVVIDPVKDLLPHAGSDGAGSRGGGHIGDHESPVIDLEHVIEERLGEQPGEQPADQAGEPLIERRRGTPGRRYDDLPGVRPVDEPAEEPLARPDPLPARPRDDSPKPAEAPAEAQARLEFLEEDMRVRFKGLHVSIDEDRVDVEVRLARGALVVVGSQGDYRFRGKLAETVAGATVHAICELLGENVRLCLSGIEEVDVGGRLAHCAVVSAVVGRTSLSYVGCAFIGEERNESAVLAVLDALNRPLGRWKLRNEIHYTIR